ncbi:MAG TPA: hypothetical protein ENJ53_06275, partial [Phaeodactylibacter sp.]|nr:hypothetical protein [Phaeodactylibacter sp.]
MMNKYTQYVSFFFFFFFVGNVFAQPSNDDCANAIEIADVVNWCSSIGEFTNVDATDSGYDTPFCFSGSDNDVWFKFTAVATDMTITVIGASSPVLGGTMWQPEVALYTGDCGGTINTFGCASDALTSNNTIQLYEGGMIVGQEYYIRIDAAGTLGSFQLCISNYFAPVEPGSDCPAAAILCDKSPFVVQQVTGAGSDPDEAAGTCLGGLGSTSESNSTWFTWTCSQSGTLTFTLTPTYPSDDLDFVVYELPNGIANCAGKIDLRCMASGSFTYPSPCMGPTGLSTSANDVVENAGCQQPTPQDNFLKALDMVAGKSYALLVNNFTSTGNGFEIEFGGTGEFLGPEADMITDEPDATICFGESVSFSDNSTFALGGLTGWEWNFGVDASPANASGIGAHEITWTTPGLKTVVLTVESDLGCIVVDVETILVEPCCETVNAMTITSTIDDENCPSSEDGSIDLTVSSNAPPHTFVWGNGQTASGLTNLGLGDYVVTITNDATCDTVLTYTVSGPPPFVITPQITKPTCDGGQDGAIELISFGGTPPYVYQWQNTGLWTSNNTLTNIPIGIYEVTLEDANGCQTSLSIEVNELELELEGGGVTSPSCFDFANGAIEVVITNGLPPFQYDFNDGNGFQNSNIYQNIPSGTYPVDVMDANGCLGHFDIVVSEPPLLTVSLDGINVSCFGAGDGTITATAGGGVGDYSFNWSNNETTAMITDLVPSTYTVTVTDGNDCQTTANFPITQPDELFIDVVEVINVICFGDETGTITVAGSGGNPPYQYSVDGTIFQDSVTFTDLAAGTHTLTIQDILGCMDEVQATIIEPTELIVDAGPDQTIDLGYSTTINSTYSPLIPITYQWLPTDGLSCTDCPNPEASPVNT